LLSTYRKLSIKAIIGRLIGGAEIDFVIQRDRKIIPIEVKSADNTRAKSLAIGQRAGCI